MCERTPQFICEIWTGEAVAEYQERERKDCTEMLFHGLRLTHRVAREAAVDIIAYLKSVYNCILVPYSIYEHVQTILNQHLGLVRPHRRRFKSCLNITMPTIGGYVRPYIDLFSL